MPKMKSTPFREEMSTRDLYLKHTDKKGTSDVRCHRVWDSELFYASAFKAAKKEGGNVELSNEAAYRAANWVES